MGNAIIGHTGFVGGNLITLHQFEQFYNSSNIENIKGREFDYLVCSGAPAVKWLANKEPEKDWENLQRLQNCLKEVTAKKVILISTVDVYPHPVEVDESTNIDREKCQPYGRHRLELEDFIAAKFSPLIVRLPGLFGQGLKKNIIYDFLHNNIGDWIHKDSIFQFYNLANLWRDIEIALHHNLSLVNFATAPTSVAAVAQEAFGFSFNQTPPQPRAYYDMKTQYFSYFPGGEAGYLCNREEVLQQIKQFVNQYLGK